MKQKIFMMSQAQSRYLKLMHLITGINQSEYIRRLVAKDMQQHQEILDTYDGILSTDNK